MDPHTSTPATRSRALGVVFLALGVTFLGVGASGQRSFLGIGPVFLVLGIVFLARARKAPPA